jgi:hypothetical protein
MIHTAYIPVQGGRPRLTFGVKGIMDNRYRLDVPAREAQTYYAGSDRGHRVSH